MRRRTSRPWRKEGKEGGVGARARKRSEGEGVGSPPPPPPPAGPVIAREHVGSRRVTGVGSPVKMKYSLISQTVGPGLDT